MLGCVRRMSQSGCRPTSRISSASGEEKSGLLLLTTNTFLRIAPFFSTVKTGIVFSGARWFSIASSSSTSFMDERERLSNLGFRNEGDDEWRRLSEQNQ